MMADANLDRIVQNRYHLLRLLGQGSMGRVYEAEDVKLGGVPVAIKFLSQTLLNDRMRDRFEREAYTCAQLGQRSIHIVRVTDHGVDDNELPFYVMEYLRGESLNDLISRQTLAIPRFLSLIRQICLGLQCAHQGISIDGKVYPIIHRDIKPSNILVSQNDSLGELVKILDFGIAKLLQAEGQQTNCFMGTLAYASPEQMEGRELDTRSDIYSLGVMMFQMLTGKMPLQADTHSFGGWYKAHRFQMPQSFTAANSNARIPKTLETLVMNCLAKSPSDRPRNASEILDALAPIEERFGLGQRIARRIETSLSKSRISVAAGSKSSSSPTDEVFRQATWPPNMPIADIVFSKPVSTDTGEMPVLWVMLSIQEIRKRLTCTRYNRFLFLEAPHPMVLWLTVLYNRQQEPRWLPCFLDLKTPQGRQMARLLGTTGEYRILFFAQEDPQHCFNVQSSTIAQAQCRLLQEWATIGQMSKSPAVPGISKDRLKAALEELKPQILKKLDSVYGNGADLPSSQG